MWPSHGWTSRSRLRCGSAPARHPPFGVPTWTAAYHGFMHSVEWYLSGRSDKAADAASWLKESEQIELGLSNTEQAEGTAKSEGGVGTAYERPQN